MFYVYLLQSKSDDTIYTGYTNDLRRIIKEHIHKQSKWASDKGKFWLIYYEAYLSKQDAKRREKNLKRHSGSLIHLKKDFWIVYETIPYEGPVA